MLETIAIILIILWLLGMVSGYTLGNFIYILLVVAVASIAVASHSGAWANVGGSTIPCETLPCGSPTPESTSAPAYRWPNCRAPMAPGPSG